MSDSNAELLELYTGLRVADVRDGLDTCMLWTTGTMHHSIKPLFRVRAYGIARTVRYIPYQGPTPHIDKDKFWGRDNYAGRYYREVCPVTPWLEDVEKGDFLVIDQSGVDCGLMGSNSGLVGFARGLSGYVTNGGVRDTDELVLQQVPFWAPFASQSVVQNRLQYDTKDITVSVGGVTVHPGDVVVADGDGVVVVPRQYAREVAKYAKSELERDKQGRLSLYKGLNWEPDETVQG
jgi:regulator of RNase E activity RraA